MQGSQQLIMSQQTDQFFKELQQEAHALGDSFISLEHFLLCWATTQTLPSVIRDFFKAHKVTKSAILAHMKVLEKGKTGERKKCRKTVSNFRKILPKYY